MTATNARTTMGWWSTTFGCADDCNVSNTCASDVLYRSVVDNLVSGGYVQAGYTWLYVEDCWVQRSRDTFGRLVPDPHLFPDGIVGLTAYAHAHGMQVAVSVDLGSQTCAGVVSYSLLISYGLHFGFPRWPSPTPRALFAGLPGSLGHYDLDILTLAGWSVDRILVTTCSVAPTSNTDTPLSLYALLSAFTSLAWSTAHLASHCVLPNATNRTLLHAISRHCQHIQLDPRIQDDYTDVQRHVVTALHELDTQQFFNTSYGPVVAGGFGLTAGQARVQLSAWLLLQFPLLLAADVRSLPLEAHDLLVHPTFLHVYKAISQSNASASTRNPTRWTGSQVPRGVDVWLWRLEGAVVLSAFRVNNHQSPYVPVSFDLSWPDLGFKSSAVCTVTNVWASAAPTHQKHRVTVTVAPFDAALLVVQPED
ncbi:hypothetical protein DYB38_011045 [Aphanomyces astaci]|uniref:Alpha-galactosidase n=1 Tax=Aphanomyces astaci TaxID=112090 RepID=A0A397EE21_APHAT|nr:hypothetical protein DYB38_011045 [Aphanomyces astaci]